MTWSRFDDAAPKSPKALAAGNEAWTLWAAAVMYCNRQLTDGYVTLAALATDCLPVPISMAKARKLAERLCDEAKVTPEGAGLFERIGKDKWKVHDFEHWNPLKAEVEARRQSERERKRGRVPSSPGSGGVPGGVPDGSQTGIQTDSAPPSAQPSARKAAGKADGFRTPAGVRAPVPVPSQPVPARPPPAPEAAVVGPIPCPADLDLDPAQRANLAMNLGIPAWFLDAVLADTRAKYADGSDPRTLERWRRTVVTTATARWSDPKNRKQPDAGGGPDAAALARRATREAAIAEAERKRQDDLISSVRSTAGVTEIGPLLAGIGGKDG